MLRDLKIRIKTLIEVIGSVNHPAVLGVEQQSRWLKCGSKEWYGT
jgi:hypothetical protein